VGFWQSSKVAPEDRPVLRGRGKRWYLDPPPSASWSRAQDTNQFNGPYNTK
jgi:hypothetical protein